MQWILVIIAVALVTFLLAMIPVVKVNREEYQRTGKHPKGYYLSLGIGIGMILGVPIGVAIGNISLGPAIGLPIGVAIGSVYEKKHKDELRPHTPREQHMQRMFLIFLGVLFVVGVAVFFMFSWFAAR